jgi:hypothetical protein
MMSDRLSDLEKIVTPAGKTEADTTLLMQMLHAALESNKQLEQSMRVMEQKVGGGRGDRSCLVLGKGEMAQSVCLYWLLQAKSASMQAAEQSQEAAKWQVMLMMRIDRACVPLLSPVRVSSPGLVFEKAS